MLYTSFTVLLDKKVRETIDDDQHMVKSGQNGNGGVAYEWFCSHHFNRFHNVKVGIHSFVVLLLYQRGGEKGQNLVLCCSFYIFLICRSKVNESYLIFLHMLLTYFASLIILCAFTFKPCERNVISDVKLLPVSKKFIN